MRSTRPLAWPLRTIAVITALLAAASSALAPPTPLADYSITGVGAESASAGKHAIGWLDKVTVGTSTIKRSFAVTDRIRSDQLVRVAIYAVVGATTYDYQAIVGAVTAGGTADSWVEADQSFRLNTTGFLFAWGYYPFVRDRWVSVGATGTTIALETYEAGKERVYLLAAGTSVDPVAKITCLANGKTYDMHMIDYATTPKPTYVDIQICSDDPVDSSGNWVLSPTTVPTSGAPATFKTRVEDIAKSGGWAE
jgi:hypothetical protein